MSMTFELLATDGAARRAQETDSVKDCACFQSECGGWIMTHMAVRYAVVPR